MNVAAIIVAAGQSTRFGGGNKLLADFRGQPLVRYAVNPAETSTINDIIIVIASDGAAILDACKPGRWRSVVNSRVNGGLSSSLQAGFAALQNDCDGALVMLADMPRVTAEIIDKMVSTFTKTDGKKIVFPVTSEGVQGNPVVWPRALFAEFNGLHEDTGGKAILAAHAGLQHPVEIDDDAIHLDVDTRHDLVSLSERDDQPQNRK